MIRSLLCGFAAATITFFAQPVQAQTTVAPAQTTAPTRAPVRVLTARTIDLVPIPSRIEHGVVAVRNTGNTTSAPSVITVNCHLPGEDGGCVDVPERLLGGYTDAAFPNMLVVQVPAIEPGHVYNHTLTFWDDIVWPSGSYQFDFNADASATNNESNEANNAGSHTWVVP
jgi:hypothetical protein